MSSKNVDACKTEFSVALEELAPESEGFQDYHAVDLIPASRGKNQEQIAAAERRRIVLENAVDALSRLEADGYPDVPVMEVDPEIYEDLGRQIQTMTAAFRRYKKGPGAAVGGEVTIK